MAEHQAPTEARPGSVEIAFRGHADVRATDTQSLEIVAGDAWSARPGAIGYAPQYDPQALLRLRGRLTLTLRVGEAEDRFEATASPLFVRGAPLVIRRDPPAARVFAIGSSKAAADLSSNVKRALRAPDARAVLLVREAETAGLPPGSLALVGMPIGNQGDLSPRALDVLSSVDVIFAEDTRVARAALGWRGVRTRLESCYAQKEALRTEELAVRLRAGERVAFISDAGMPAVSDPGARLARVAADLGASVTVVPGASAVTTAIAISGISGERFSFLGFPARKGAERREQLQAIVMNTAPSVLFESPKRVASLVRQLCDLAPERQAAVCRDLTKRTEAVIRGALRDLAGELEEASDLRGEYVVVVAGAEATKPAEETSGGVDLEAFIRALLEQDCPTAPIVAALQSRGMARRSAYDLVQTLRRARGR